MLPFAEACHSLRRIVRDLTADTDKDVETTIPFWEFLDIEFYRESREFRFVAHYLQGPSFPNLFARLIGSPPMQKISEEWLGKKKPKKERSTTPSAPKPVTPPKPVTAPQPGTSPSSQPTPPTQTSDGWIRTGS